MDELLDTIRHALAPDAAPETRAAGAQACRAILAALEPQPAPAAAPPGAAPLPIAELATAIRTIPLDQLLDLAITKLRSALPAGADAPTVKPLDFRLVPVQRRTS